MASGPVIIEIDPESELGKALEIGDIGRIVLEREGERFYVSRDPTDPWATYDPERVRAGLRKYAGMISEEEGERMKEVICRGREEGTRPLERP
jgi:hypothetical protein